jgi:hypothetical protein
MNLMIRDLVTWEPQGEQVDGYSIAIACMRELAPVAIANLRLCARMNNARLHQLILVFDCPVDKIPASVAEAVREASSSLAVRLLGYNERQHRVTKWIDWGWVYSWASWSLAIRQAQTRVAIIHDLDAMPLSADFFEQIYDHWAEQKAQFCGIRPYRGNGIEEDMGLVTTFELALDVTFMRRTFRPFDLFNKLHLVGDRIVDFDTMLHAQWRSPHRAVRPIEETQLVHPSQLICQYTALVSGRTDFQGREHSLPVLAYFAYLGGDPIPLTTAGPHLAEEKSRSVPLFGRNAYIDGVTPQGWAWMEKQIRRIEQHCYGETRPEVASYLDGMIERAGSHRTVGNEAGTFAVPER